MRKNKYDWERFQSAHTEAISLINKFGIEEKLLCYCGQ